MPDRLFRACAFCDASLAGSRPDARFCGAACRARAHRRALAQDAAHAALQAVGLRPLDHNHPGDTRMDTIADLIDLPTLLRGYAPGAQIVYTEHDRHRAAVLDDATATATGLVGWEA